MTLSRIKVLQKNLKTSQAFLVANPTDILYYVGFEWLVPAEREAFLLLTQKHAYFFYASFSPFQAVRGLQAFAGCYPHQVVTHIKKILETDVFTDMFIDAESTYLNEYQALEKIDGLIFHNLDRTLIWTQRYRKDESEIAAHKKAVEISLAAYDALLPQLSIGMTEQDVCTLLENYCKHHGAEAMAFPTIVAFGPHAALPHHQPSSVPLKKETPILIDFGAKYNHYCADMTRTLWFGDHPSEKFETTKEIVHQAYDAALEMLKRDQVTAKMVDTAARNVIEQAGYGQHFIHTTGHGVGLDIHEPPSLNWKNETVLEKHMIITIEPGIYFEDEFGYRYENSIVIS